MTAHGSKFVLGKNIFMLYLMIGARYVLPMILLPYLTRVLSKDCYGAVAYVKSFVSFEMVIVSFGFMFSATREVAMCRGDRVRLSGIIGDVTVAQLLLAALTLVGMGTLTWWVPILRDYRLFAVLSFLAPVLTIFMFDYLFMGLEEMEVITKRYVLMRSIVVVLTFLVVRNDAQMFLLPVLEIVGEAVAVALVAWELRKRGLRLRSSGWGGAWKKLRGSFIYFASNIATTAFGTLNTMVCGFFMPVTLVAEWGVCSQLAGTIQMLYNPLITGLYPYMVRHCDIRFARRMIVVLMALIAVGCVVVFFGAELMLLLVGGGKYRAAAPLLRAFIPLLFFSFPAMFFGWPMLGAIGRAKEVAFTTISAGIISVLGMLALGVGGVFTVFNLAFLRGGTDLYLFLSRLFFCRKYRADFAAHREKMRSADE